MEIAPIANRQKATVQVKVQILRPDDRLRPDMNASVAFVDPAAPHQQGAANRSSPFPPPPSRTRASLLSRTAKPFAGMFRLPALHPQGVRISQGLLGGEDLILNAPANLKDGEKVRVEGEHP